MRTGHHRPVGPSYIRLWRFVLGLATKTLEAVGLRPRQRDMYSDDKYSKTLLPDGQQLTCIVVSLLLVVGMCWLTLGRRPADSVLGVDGTTGSLLTPGIGDSVTRKDKHTASIGNLGFNDFPEETDGDAEEEEKLPLPGTVADKPSDGLSELDSAVDRIRGRRTDKHKSEDRLKDELTPRQTVDVSVVLFCEGLSKGAAVISAQLEALIGQTPKINEIFVVAEAEDSRETFTQLESSFKQKHPALFQSTSSPDSPRLEFVSQMGHGFAGAFNTVAQQARSLWLLPLELQAGRIIDMNLSPDLSSVLREAIESNRQKYSGALTNVIAFSGTPDISQGTDTERAVFLRESLLPMNLRDALISQPLLLLRKDVMRLVTGFHPLMFLGWQLEEFVARVHARIGIVSMIVQRDVFSKALKAGGVSNCDRGRGVVCKALAIVSGVDTGSTPQELAAAYTTVTSPDTIRMLRTFASAWRSLDKGMQHFPVISLVKAAEFRVLGQEPDVQLAIERVAKLSCKGNMDLRALAEYARLELEAGRVSGQPSVSAETPSSANTTRRIGFPSPMSAPCAAELARDQSSLALGSGNANSKAELFAGVIDMSGTSNDELDAVDDEDVNDLQKKTVNASDKTQVDTGRHIMNWRAAQRCSHLLVAVKKWEMEGNETVDLTHFIITTAPDGNRALLMQRAISSALKHNANTQVILHMDLANMHHKAIRTALGSLITHPVFMSRVTIVPLCYEHLAVTADFRDPLMFLLQYENEPYFYSHITDLYRYLVLFSVGGVYLDTDVVLRTATSHLQNALAWETHMRYINGAFMKFQAKHAFVEYCLQHFRSQYKPSVWGCVGPELLSMLYTCRTRPPIEELQSSNASLSSAVLSGGALKNCQERSADISALGSNAFYRYSWQPQQVVKFMEESLSDAEWSQQELSTIGYHFWGRVLFRDSSHNLQDLVVSRTSAASRVLDAACLPGSDCSPIIFT